MKWISSAILLYGAIACSSEICKLRIPDDAEPLSEQWPCTFGIPFQEGSVKDMKNLSLFSRDGRKIPLQASSVVKWADGTVKWALLDFSTEKKTCEYSIVSDEPEALSESKGLAEKTGKGIFVNTGKIALSVCPPISETSLFDITFPGKTGTSGADVKMTLLHDSPGLPQEENWLVDAPPKKKFTEFSALKDNERELVLEENGPQRAAIRISGWLKSNNGRKAFKYILRIHAFKNSARLKLQYTFIATENVKDNFLSSMKLFIPFSGEQQKAITSNGKDIIEKEIGKDNELSISVTGSPRFYHFVSFKNPKTVISSIQYRNGGNWNKCSTGTTAPGWEILSNNNGSLLCAMQDFRYLHPKEISASCEGLFIHFWPERSGKVLDLRRRSNVLLKEYIENGSDINEGKGIAKTHEFWLEFSDKPFSMETADAFSNSVNKPPYPYAGADYYRKTLAFGEFMPENKELFPKTEAAVAFGFKYLRAMRNAFGLDGMIDWGDVPIAVAGQPDHSGKSCPDGLPFRGYKGWCNNDFGLCHGFFLHYLRTGDYRVFKDGIDMVMHVMDIDTEHYSPEEPGALGRGHRHDQQHWGNGSRGYCYAPDGAIDLFLLTGNRRALDVAREMADNIGTYGRYMPLRLWEITGEKKYLDFAEDTLKKDLRGGKKKGWPFMLDTNFRASSYDNIGYIFYDSIRPDPALKKACIDGIEFLRERYTVPWKDKVYPPYGILSIGAKYNPSPENIEVLKILVWLLNPFLPEKNDMLNIADDAPFEKFHELNLKILKMTRTDLFSLFFTANLPYALEQLRKNGVSEKDCLNYEWKWSEPASFEETLKVSDMTLEKAPSVKEVKSWNYYTFSQVPTGRVNPLMPPYIRAKWESASKRVRLYEDKQLLGPHPFWRSLLIKNGKIGWAMRLSAALVFCTPDNSDPRSNGRTYTLHFVNEKDWKWEDKKSFTETLVPEKIYPYPDISKGQSDIWCYMTENESPEPVLVYPPPSDLQKRYEAAMKRHSFCEDGNKLDYVKDLGALMNGGKKGWTRHQNLIVFRTDAGEIPGKNRKKYVLSYINEKETVAHDVK